MRANLIMHRDAFRMHLNPELVQIDAGKSIYDVLFTRGYFSHNGEGMLVRSSAFVVLYNGEPVLQKDWNTMVCEDDLVQVIHLPRGGGGSNIMNILMAVLAAVLAYFTFGLSLVASAAVGVAVYAGLTLIGSMVPKPSVGSLSRDRTSTNYSLNAQSNEAKLLGTIPRLYGRMRTFPDLAAQPYTEYRSNDQYLFQLFCVSLGDVDIEKIFIEDTDIAEFEDAEYQIVKPGQAVTLFPDNVVTSAAVQQLEMHGPDDEAYLVLGPFVTSPTDTNANYIGLDIALPSGMGQLDDRGNTRERIVQVQFEYQTIDNTGAPTGSWNVLLLETFKLATNEAQMMSYKIEVPLGRYQVRARRLTNKAANTRTFDRTVWTGLRAYLQSTFVYPDVTLIAVAMRASNVLNSDTARSFSVIGKSLLQRWNPVDGFTAATFTNNPAWIAMDILRNQVYGRGLETSRYNIFELHRLSQVWDIRGDTFNGIFDTTTQMWDALQKVLQVGRTTPIPYAGVIDFVRDEPKALPQAMFQPSNMLAGSFETTYSFFSHESPDHVIVEYIDPVTWLPATVECKLAGEPDNNPKTVELFGCTNRDQAWREGMYMAMANRDRRRQITFTTTKAGLIPYYLTLARVAHDVPQWGYFGRVISLDVNNGKLRTSEPIVFDGSPNHVIAFRKRDGSEHGPFPITRDNSLADGEHGCILAVPTSTRQTIYVSDGIREDFTFYQCGPTEREGLKVLVTSAKPNDDGTVALTCMNYADSVYAAENGGVIPPPPPASNLPITPAAPIVDWVEVVYTTTVGQQNILASPARGAIYYEFRAKDLSNPGVWLNLGNSDQPRLVIHLAPAQWTVEVRGVGRVPGPWAAWTGPIEWTSLPTAKLDAFTAVSKLFAVGLLWLYDDESLSICERVELRVGSTNVLANSQLLAYVPYPGNTFDHNDLAIGQSFFYWARVIDTAGREGPWFNNGTPLFAGASTDAEKILEYLQGKITETQLGQALLEKIDNAVVDLTGVYNEIEEVRQESIDGDNAQTQQINNAVSVAGNAASLAQSASTTAATADGKASTAITNAATAVSQAGAAQATAQTALTATADINGDLAAMYTIKTQLTVNGQRYLSGLGVGVENNQGIITTQILLAAQRVAVLDESSGTLVTPFVIQGGKTIINEAIIGLLSANKINVGYGGNMLANSSVVTLSGWQLHDTITVNFGINLAPEWKTPNENCLYIHQPQNWFNGDNTRLAMLYTDVPVKAGERYEYSAYIGAHRCWAWISVEYYNAGGGYLAPLNETADWVNQSAEGGGVSLANYKRVWRRSNVPSGAVRARFVLGKYPTLPGNSDSYAFFTRPMMAPIVEGQVAFTDYQPTGQGVMITPAGITTPSLQALSPNLGIIVNGMLRSSDGMMHVNMDTKEILMLKNGRRVQITSAGFYFGADNGIGNQLLYNIDAGAMILNGTFTADALNAVNTSNISGQGAATLKWKSGNYGILYGGDNNDSWITILSEFTTLKSGGNGIIIVVEFEASSTTDAIQGIGMRLLNQSGQILREWIFYEDSITGVAYTDKVSIPVTDVNALVGNNTYTLQTKHRGTWVAHQFQRLTILSSHR